MTPEEHFDKVRAIYRTAYSDIKLYLKRLDGDTSRHVGSFVQGIVDGDIPSNHDWPTMEAAKFIRSDTELWHEVANSRKA